MKVRSLLALAVFFMPTISQSLEKSYLWEGLPEGHIVSEDSQLLSINDLEDLELQARSRLEKGNCQEAAPMLAAGSMAADHISQIILRGIEPFYRSGNAQGQLQSYNGTYSRTSEVFQSPIDMMNLSRDQKIIDSIDLQLVPKLIKAEALAKAMKTKRNEFLVLEAECLIELGQQNLAINILYQALNFIDPIEQPDVWKKARTLIWASVGYE